MNQDEKGTVVSDDADTVGMNKTIQWVVVVIKADSPSSSPLRSMDRQEC